MNRIAHQDRRLGGIENDDRLAAGGVTDLFQSASGGVGELVDILSGARTGAFARDSGDDLGVLHRRDLLSALTSGTVAWPPQLTRLTLLSPTCSSRLTSGIT